MYSCEGNMPTLENDKIDELKLEIHSELGCD